MLFDTLKRWTMAFYNKPTTYHQLNILWQTMTSNPYIFDHQQMLEHFPQWSKLGNSETCFWYLKLHQMRVLSSSSCISQMVILEIMCSLRDTNRANWECKTSVSHLGKISENVVLTIYAINCCASFIGDDGNSNTDCQFTWCWAYHRQPWKE